MSDSEEEIYYVERILGHKILRGKRYFLIKWIDFDESENSWEPEKNINPDLVIYYDTNFAEENDASVANLYRSAPKKRKVYVGEKKKKKKPGKGKTAEENVETEENPAEEYEDPASKYIDDPVTSYINQTTNYEYSADDDNIKPSTSRDYQEASLSQAATEPTERATVSNASQSPPKPRVISVNGYSRLQFKDKKLHMLVQFSDQPEAKFVPHDIFRYEYPQELIDFYESHTQWADRERFSA